MLPEELRCAGRRATGARKHQTRRRSRLRGAAASVPDDTPRGRTARPETPPEFHAYSSKISFATKRHKRHKNFLSKNIRPGKTSPHHQKYSFCDFCAFSG